MDWNLGTVWLKGKERVIGHLECEEPEKVRVSYGSV